MRIINQTEAIKYLQAGKTIVFPTETSYGLGCDALNQEAVDRVFKIKGRVGKKPLLVVVSSVAMARQYLEWNGLLERLAKKHWPGALTIVGKCKTQDAELGLKLAEGVMSEDGTVAVRVTNAEIPKYLSDGLDRPLVATSANITTMGDIYDSKEVIEVFGRQEFQPDAIIDAGVLPRNPPTTIVSVVDGNLRLLRQGEIKI